MIEEFKGVTKQSDLGPEVKSDDTFKKKARLHQSWYRAEVLKVKYQGYGNRITEKDGKNLLNYYNKMNVKEVLRKRYPEFSNLRDSNLLRSEHIPFNMFAPLIDNNSLALKIIKSAFNISLEKVLDIQIEFAPSPKEKYLNDNTSFDAYVSGINLDGKSVGIGIEVKYTERGYSLKNGSSEWEAVKNPVSPYWKTAMASKAFINPKNDIVTKNHLRQIWRNHLLGLSMMQVQDIDIFYSITLYPDGNRHFHEVIPEYEELLVQEHREYVSGCTFEKFIEAIPEQGEYTDWKKYLLKRYIVE